MPSFTPVCNFTWSDNGDGTANCTISARLNGKLLEVDDYYHAWCFYADENKIPINWFLGTDTSSYSSMGVSIYRTVGPVPYNGLLIFRAIFYAGDGTVYWDTQKKPSRAPDYTPKRPADWDWKGSVSSGFSLSWLTGQTWRDFIDRINDFAEYKKADISGYTMTKPGTATSLQTVSTSQVGTSLTIMQACSQAAAAINALDPPTRAPYPRAGAAISAAYFDALRDALNSIE